VTLFKSRQKNFQ